MYRKLIQTILLVLLLVFFINVRVFFAQFLIPYLVPDILIMFVIFYAIKKGVMVGALLGFVLGFFNDIFIEGPFFFYTIIWGVIGYSTGLFRELLYRLSPFIAFLLVFVTTLLSQISYYVLSVYVFKNLTVGLNPIVWILSVAFVTSLLAPPSFAILEKIDKL